MTKKKKRYHFGKLRVVELSNKYINNADSPNSTIGTVRSPNTEEIEFDHGSHKSSIKGVTRHEIGKGDAKGQNFTDQSFQVFGDAWYDSSSDLSYYHYNDEGDSDGT